MAIERQTFRVTAAHPIKMFTNCFNRCNLRRYYLVLKLVKLPTPRKRSGVTSLICVSFIDKACCVRCIHSPHIVFYDGIGYSNRKKKTQSTAIQYVSQWNRDQQNINVYMYHYFDFEIYSTANILSSFLEIITIWNENTKKRFFLTFVNILKCKIL